MKEFFSEIRGAVMSTVALAIVCCGLYPLVVFGIGQALFRDKANGSLIVDSTGAILGSRLLGQQFSSDKYFHSRPSAAGNGYDTTSSGGSNLGPTSQKLHDSIAQNISDYRAQNGLSTNAVVPADAVTASASGLDPHISLENARIQSARVAKARGLKEEAVAALVTKYTDMADLGFLGDPGVNVLELNLALDAQNNGMDLLTIFGIFAVTAMLVCYACENRSNWFVLGFAFACALGSIYGFLQGAWPFGIVEAVWSVVAFFRWRANATTTARRS